MTVSTDSLLIVRVRVRRIVRRGNRPDVLPRDVGPYAVAVADVAKVCSPAPSGARVPSR